jgi:thiamine biosynthesis protein ThiS
MTIVVNGEAREYAQATTVNDLIAQLGLNPKTIVVQRNDDIVDRASFDAAALNDGDRIELVRFVGGG